MQKTRHGFLDHLGILVVLLLSSLATAMASEAGFKDSLRAVPLEVSTKADTTIKNLSRKHGIPIVFKTISGLSFSEKHIKVEPLSITVQLLIERGFQAEVKVGEGVQAKGMFSVEDAENLSHVMNAYAKEGLAHIGLFAGIQFLNNKLDKKQAPQTHPTNWEHYILIVLVGLFLLIAGWVTLNEGSRSSRGSAVHHPF